MGQRFHSFPLVSGAIAFCLIGVIGLSGCSGSFSRELTAEYGAPVEVTYAPTTSSEDVGTSLTLVTGDGVALSAEVAAGDVYDDQGETLSLSEIEPGDVYELYAEDDVDDSSNQEVEAAALVLVSRGGQETADEASEARAARDSSSLTFVYTPTSEEDYAEDIAQKRLWAWGVMFEGDDDDGDPATLSIPDLAMYDMDGNHMALSDLEPGDVFVAYVYLIYESYPASYLCYRLELVERGGWDLVEELADSSE